MTTSPTHDKATPDPAVAAEVELRAILAIETPYARDLDTTEAKVDALARISRCHIHARKALDLLTRLAGDRERARNERDAAEKSWIEEQANTDHVRNRYVTKLLAAEAERDALKAEQLADANTHAETVHRLYEDLSALKQRVAEVLAPFGRLGAQMVESYLPGEEALAWSAPFRDGDLMLSHFRRTAELHASLTEDRS